MKIKYNVYLVFIFHFVFLHQKNRPYFLTARRHVAVGTGHLDGAVKHVVRGDGRGNSVDGAAEGGHSVTVNGRVVHLHHTAERVIYNPAARHNNPVRRRHGADGRRQQQQQQQQYDADMTNRIHNNDYSLILHFLEQQ